MTRPLAACALLAACATAQAQPAPFRTFTSPNPEPGGTFGAALAVLGDVDGDGVPDLLVGAPKEQAYEEPARVQGRAYVLSGAAGEVAYALASPNDAPQLLAFRGEFGEAVAALGDLDGDGTGDFVVGAPGDSPEGEEGVGAAYVFSGATGTLLHALTHPPAQYQIGFGAAVADVGDVDGDGVGDVGVGAFESGEQLACGALGTTGLAYVFSGATGDPLYTLAPEADCETYFGQSIAGLGDVDADGRPDFAVGSLGDAGGGPFYLAGRVHVYSGATGNELYTLESPNAQNSGGFSRRYALSAISDVDGDGVRDLLVGAVNESATPGGETYEGRAYVFSGADGALVHTLTSPNEAFGSSFGFTVGAAGDLDDDGTPDLLVSAFDELRPTIDGAGRVYALSGATGDALFQLDSPTPLPFGLFGLALDGTADLTGDGRPDLVVGQPDTFVGLAANDPGRVFLYSSMPTRAESGPPPGSPTLVVAPNPAVGTARVTWDAETGPARLVAYDMLGREVAALEATGEAALDVSGWAPGLYVLRLETADGVQTQRFTVAR